MSRIRSRDTTIELEVRKRLYAIGLRYRLRSKLPGHPDVVFPGKKVAVFIHGCFWHMHGCRLSALPSTRSAYWLDKLRGNKRRDAQAAESLKQMGWKIVTVWECNLKKHPSQEITRITEAVRGSEGTPRYKQANFNLGAKDFIAKITCAYHP